MEGREVVLKNPAAAIPDVRERARPPLSQAEIEAYLAMVLKGIFD